MNTYNIYSCADYTQKLKAWEGFSSTVGKITAPSLPPYLGHDKCMRLNSDKFLSKLITAVNAATYNVLKEHIAETEVRLLEIAKEVEKEGKDETNI